MPRVRVDTGVNIEYETFGDPKAPKGAAVLIMGLSMQLVGWRTEMCEMLAQRGFYVVRFDNRDAGLSSRWSTDPRCLLPRVLMCKFLCCCCPPFCAPSVPYTLEDMADDVVGLMSALKIDSAHFMGSSMGGMIAQLIALNYPERTRSLCSVFSTTGNMKLPQPSLEVRWMVASQPPKNATRQQIIADRVAKVKKLCGPKYYNEMETLEKIAEADKRCTDVSGAGRQLCAILASPDRTERLKTLRVPTLVCHGDVDPLVPYAHALATCAAIPNAELYTLEGVGHILPRVFFAPLLDEFERNCARTLSALPSSSQTENVALLRQTSS